MKLPFVTVEPGTKPFHNVDIETTGTVDVVVRIRFKHEKPRKRDIDLPRLRQSVSS